MPILQLRAWVRVKINLSALFVMELLLPSGKDFDSGTVATILDIYSQGSCLKYLPEHSLF